jgi:hypothetical protein
MSANVRKIYKKTLPACQSLLYEAHGFFVLPTAAMYGIAACHARFKVPFLWQQEQNTAVRLNWKTFLSP